MQKERFSLSRKSLIGTLVVVTTMAMTLPPKGWAMLAPAQVSHQVLETNDARAAGPKTIQTALESKMIRRRLAEFKLTPEQIDGRLGRLSDAQVHQTAMQIRSVNPGGDASGGVLVTVLVVGVLAILFVWLSRRD